MNFEKIEAIFFSVLEDIHDFLPDLTLVGGWLPYIYTNFLWKTSVRNPVTTVDRRQFSKPFLFWITKNAI